MAVIVGLDEFAVNTWQLLPAASTSTDYHLVRYFLHSLRDTLHPAVRHLVAAVLTIAAPVAYPPLPWDAELLLYY